MDQISPFEEVDERDGERDRRFEPYRHAFTDKAKAVVAEVRASLLRYEVEHCLQKNRRRPVDQATFDLTVDAIVSNVVHHQLGGNWGNLYVTRSNRVLGMKSRYRPRVYSKKFPDVLDLMEKRGLIVQDVPPPVEGQKRSTVIRVGEVLSWLIEEHGIDLDDFGLHPHGETIILKKPKDTGDYWDQGGFEEYDDTPETDRFRAEVDRINQWLTSADLAFSPVGVPLPHTVFHIGDRQLRRIFTKGRFDCGGRLFGGFWQELRKDERRKGLRIDGEEAVELDYGQIGPRIVYGLASETPPEGDLYDCPGYNRQRDGIKRVMSAMIFASNRLERFPKDTKKLFRTNDKISEVVNAIEARHPHIRDFFHCGVGHRAQFIESTILIKVLLTLMDVGVTALPIHDAVMVPASKVSLSRDIMLSAFHDHTGLEGVVSTG